MASLAPHPPPAGYAATAAAAAHHLAGGHPPAGEPATAATADLATLAELKGVHHGMDVAAIRRACAEYSGMQQRG